MPDLRPVDGPEILNALREAAAERILVLDGAMGTEIQNLKLGKPIIAASGSRTTRTTRRVTTTS
jgi:hypothetical protein